MKNLFEMDHTITEEVSSANHLTHRFVAETKGDMFFDRRTFALTKATNPITNVLLTVKSHLDKDTSRIVAMPHDNGALIQGTYDEKPVFIWVQIEDAGDVHKLRFDITADVVSVKKLAELIDQDFNDEFLPLVKWWHKGQHGDDATRDFYLPKDSNVILPEFYPNVSDIRGYVDDYMNSSASILLIAGPPGTGKTSLLRFMINKYRLTAHVIYDERIMDRDTPFQGFLFGDNVPRHRHVDYTEGNDIMIIEDADSILTSRERDGNPMMARFLNVADGLIKLPNKKLVFTTNILNFENVDHALLRPGRCFGVLHTRELNFHEAQDAARAAGMPIPQEKREYALAEIFNQGKTVKIKKVGF